MTEEEFKDKKATPANEAAEIALLEWLERHVKNSVISQNTPAYNEIHGHVSAIRFVLNSIKGV